MKNPMVNTSWQGSRLNNTPPRKENLVKKPEDREFLLVKNPIGINQLAGVQAKQHSPGGRGQLP